MPLAPPDSSDAIAQTAKVRAVVLAGLGRPPGLRELSVRPLWDNCYRVNVLIGTDVASTRIAHSFFVTLGVGDRVTTDPPLSRTYP